MESNENPTSESDSVTVFQIAAGGTDEMELETVRALLEASGIQTILVGDQPLPNFSQEIRVASADAEQAQQLIREALAAGPSGAAEAEAEGEK